jgi:hypothetical protein
MTKTVLTNEHVSNLSNVTNVSNVANESNVANVSNVTMSSPIEVKMKRNDTNWHDDNETTTGQQGKFFFETFSCNNGRPTTDIVHLKVVSS